MLPHSSEKGGQNEMDSLGPAGEGLPAKAGQACVYSAECRNLRGPNRGGKAGLEREEAGIQSCLCPNTQGGLGGGALLLLVWNWGTGCPRCFVALMALGVVRE